MQVDFYVFPKKTNSTKQVTGNPAFTKDCQLKEPCDITKPTLILETREGTTINYCHIPAWGRYYFIDEITYLTGHRMQISCTEDYLGTWKNSILTYSAFVERSYSNYNSLFDDNLVSNTENITSVKRTTTDLPSPYSDIGCYLLKVVSGGDSNSSGVTSFIVNGATFDYVMQKIFDPAQYSFLSDEVVKSFFNPFQYIVSAMWLPITINAFETEGPTTEIYCGWWDTGQKGSIPVDNGVEINLDPALPQSNYSDFRAYSPRFSNYSLFLPAYGNVEIPAPYARGGIHIQLTVDCANTGQGRYIISNKSSGAVINTFTTQFGVPIQISQMNPSFGGVVSGAGGILGSVLTGNIGGVVSNLVSSAQSMLSPGASVNGTAGNWYDLYKNHSVVFSLFERGTGDRPISRAGNPCYKQLSLGSLTDFVKCGNASLPMSGYQSERDAVNNYLNSGFYIE